MRIEMHARLARKEQHHQYGEEHHVPGQGKENKEPDALQAFAGPSARILPVVVASAATSTSRTTVDGRLASNSRFFAFYFRWGAAKGDGHGEASVVVE
jgi:hypothetical protein